jgi:hypothetical protein
MPPNPSALTGLYLENRMVLMGTILIATFATAFILTGLEAWVISLGKWRAIPAFILNVLFCLNLNVKLTQLFTYTLAATFLSLTFSILVERLFSNQEDGGDLPRRIPPR